MFEESNLLKAYNEQFGINNPEDVLETANCCCNCCDCDCCDNCNCCPCCCCC